VRGKYEGYPESKFRWTIKKNKNTLQTMYIAIWCTYHTLLFNTVSTIVEALVIALHQFLYPFIVEWCCLWCKARGNGDEVCLHSMDCCFDSGVAYDTHVSSPVTTLLKKLSPSSIYRVRESNALACHLNLCSSVSIFSTQHAHNFQNLSLSDTISWRVTVKSEENAGKVT